MEMEKHERKQRNKKEAATVISPPPGPALVLQNVVDVAGGKHAACAERLEGQHFSSSGGNMNER